MTYIIHIRKAQPMFRFRFKPRHPLQSYPKRDHPPQTPAVFYADMFPPLSKPVF